MDVVFAHLPVCGDGNRLARLKLKKHVPVEVALPHGSDYRPQCHHLPATPQWSFKGFQGGTARRIEAFLDHDMRPHLHKV